MTERERLVFVSTRFLFPTDSGGKIRTTQVLRGLKGGKFHITLLMPASSDERRRFNTEIESVCDALESWHEPGRGGFWQLLRKAAWLLRQHPIPVMSDWNKKGAEVVSAALAARPDVVVFDFPHAAVLAPARLSVPSVMFTHNIEAEIFERHWKVARFPLRRWLWRNQYHKMRRFEKSALQAFDTVIAVSERDCTFFRDIYDIERCGAIPTGVDTEYFDYRPPGDDPLVVFCGSMDWMANVDGVIWFAEQVWPLIRKRMPDARMKVIGRSPPDSLRRRIAQVAPDWELTGFVDDVRDHVGGASAFVIPLRVGGGTRIKAFEAMATGTPVVSTAIGIEGLPVEDGIHYLCADDPGPFADHVVSLLNDREQRDRLSQAARQLVTERYGFRNAAAVFEELCVDTAARCSAGEFPADYQ